MQEHPTKFKMDEMIIYSLGRWSSLVMTSHSHCGDRQFESGPTHDWFTFPV
jgi:hypothetical protein